MMNLKAFIKPLAVTLALLIVLTGCHKKKEQLRYGIDINRLNPLVTTAVDLNTGKKVFSRDPSIISSVTGLFEAMKCTPASEPSGEKGVSFTVSTMFGDFTFGECWGNRLRLAGEEYTLERDYSKDIRLLFDRLASETQHTAKVPRERILAVTRDMTYRELLDKFGETLETAVVGEERAWLYQYHDRPFYIRYKKDYDRVNMTGEQLLREIWKNYNLDKALTMPEPLGGGRLTVYTQAFDRVLEDCLESGKSRPDELVIDTEKLVYLDEDERKELIAHFQDRFSLNAIDSGLAMMAAEGDLVQDSDRDRLILWIKQYSFIGDKRMDFVAAAGRNGETAVTKNMTFKLENHNWKG